MVGVAAEWRGCGLVELEFNSERRLSCGESGAVADAKNVGVDCKCLLTPSAIKDDIGGFSPHAGQ